MFESVCSQGSRRSGRTLSVSLLMHLIVVGALLAAPLWCFEQLPQEAFVTYLAVPPPAPTPPAPPPAPAPRKAPTTPMRSRILRPDFTQPLEIPKEVPEAPEELPEITGTWLESWDR
ncbi:MAG TPA: hypothetical protein VLV83_25720, partial [Acidobacteriota bacterium]|nr:hypothetical protein [Acidobacteriota bacterium]